MFYAAELLWQVKQCDWNDPSVFQLRSGVAVSPWIFGRKRTKCYKLCDTVVQHWSGIICVPYHYPKEYWPISYSIPWDTVTKMVIILQYHLINCSHADTTLTLWAHFTEHFFSQTQWKIPLWCCHNERDGISNHQPHDCLLNRLFKAQIKENIKAPRHWPFFDNLDNYRMLQ